MPNKDGDKPADTVSGSTPAGEELRKMLRKAEAEAGIDMRDVADGECEDGQQFWLHSYFWMVGHECAYERVPAMADQT